MSIILKGIDIPKDGYIPARIYSNGHIWINGSYKGVAIQIKEGISECSGCKYHELDSKEFPCYECRRNYYDKYEEEGYEEE